MAAALNPVVPKPAPTQASPHPNGPACGLSKGRWFLPYGISLQLFIGTENMLKNVTYFKKKKVTNSNKIYSPLNNVAAGAKLNSYKLQIQISVLMQTQYRAVKMQALERLQEPCSFVSRLFEYIFTLKSYLLLLLIPLIHKKQLWVARNVFECTYCEKPWISPPEIMYCAFFLATFALRSFGFSAYFAVVSSIWCIILCFISLSSRGQN